MIDEQGSAVIKKLLELPGEFKIYAHTKYTSDYEYALIKKQGKGCSCNKLVIHLLSILSSKSKKFRKFSFLDLRLISILNFRLHSMGRS
jgi:hypothetical protein